MSDKTYPMPGFPKVSEATTEDWVPIDGQWHSLVYVHHPHGVATDLYVDGGLIPASGEMTMPAGGPRAWDRALSQAQMERIYREGPGVMTETDREIEAALVEAFARHPGWVTVDIHGGDYTIWGSPEKAISHLQSWIDAAGEPKRSYADSIRALNLVYYSGDDPAFTGREDGMKIELMLRNGRALDVPTFERVDSKGFAHFAPVVADEECTVVGCRVTLDVPPERLRPGDSYTLSIRGLDVQ